MVTKDMNMLEAIEKYPTISKIFDKYKLGCIGCMIASGETVGQGLEAHNLDVDKIVEEMNDLIKLDQ